MKNLLFIALMLSFLIGNAQQDRQQFVPNSINDQDQSYTDNHPEYPILFDMYKNDIRITEDHPWYPAFIELYKNDIRIIDGHPGDNILFELYKDEIRKTDYHPEIGLINPYRYSSRKTD